MSNRKQVIEHVTTQRTLVKANLGKPVIDKPTGGRMTSMIV